MRSFSRLVRVLYRLSAIGVWAAAVGGVTAAIAIAFLKEFDLTTIVHGIALPEGLRAPNGGVQVLAHIVEPSGRARFLVGLTLFVGIGLFAFGLLQVREILRSVRAGDPFIGDNVRRLRLLGGLFIVSPMAVSILMAIATTAAVPDEIRDIITWHFGVSLSALVSAALMFVLAEVFAHGLRLRDEIEGTV